MNVSCLLLFASKINNREEMVDNYKTCETVRKKSQQCRRKGMYTVSAKYTEDYEKRKVLNGKMDEDRIKQITV